METIHFNFFQLLILFGSIQGVIFSLIVFFVKKYRSKSGFFLGLTVLFLSISNIQHMLIDVGYFTEASIIKKAYIPWQWLVAPMFYLFAYYFLNTKSVDKKKLFYLIAPFFIVAVVHGIQLLYHLYFNQGYHISNYYERGLFLYTNMLSFIHIPGVIFFMYRMITSYEKKHFGAIEKVKGETTWLKNLIHIGVSIVSLGTLSAVLGIVLDMKQSYYAYPFFISLSLWIYWVGYVGINRSSSSEKLKRLQNTQSSKKMGYDTFTRINEYIITEKKYLSVDINLNTIADQFEISNGYLSQLMNANTQKSFNDHINELRVEASKKMLTDVRYDNYTIESIGLECGFKSKSNFYSTFKKFSGQTPNQFKKSKK
ncbi:helix-turn-helix domain-containing protein [Aquimarina sp. 2304DJ70-9]|uniref:helix-turn-helix domain-containing protein n=1 Tax=Aquimarina penaris TaxID=3231044 RepID=UPI003462007E